MDFEHIFRRPLRNVCQPPAARQYFIHDAQVGVQPHGGDVEPNPKHVDRRVQTAVPSVGEEQTLVRIKIAPKGQAAQSAQERIAIPGLYWLRLGVV